MSLRDFFADKKGVTLVIIAVGLPAILFILTGALDITKLQKSYSLTQDSTDAASLVAADVISKYIRNNTNQSAVSKLPDEDTIKVYVNNSINSNLQHNTNGSELLLDSVEVNVLESDDYIDVEVSACSKTKVYLVKYIHNDKTCTLSTARLFPTGMRNVDLAFSFESNYHMGGSSTRQRFAWTFVGTHGVYDNPNVSHYYEGVLPKFFKSTEYMEDNNIYASFIPFTEKMNIFPYSSSFIDDYDKIENAGLDQYDPAVLMSNYPVLTKDRFEDLLNSPNPVTYPSVYDTFRLDKDISGKRGAIYENNPNLLFDTEYQEHDTRHHIYYPKNLPGLNIYDKQLSTMISRCPIKSVRRAYVDIIEKKYIQPLTFSYESLEGYFENFHLSDYNANPYICHNSVESMPRYESLKSNIPEDWREPDPLEEDVPAHIKGLYKNKHLNCNLNINGYGEDSAAANWIGLWWAWQTLDQRNKDKWAANSFHEDLAKNHKSAKVPNGNRFDDADDDRRQVIIHFTIADDHLVSGSYRGFCDAYSNIDASAHPHINQALIDDTFDRNSDFDSVNFVDKTTSPSNTTSYKKLCDAIKASGVEIYIVDYLAGNVTRTRSHEQILSCASSPDHVILASVYDLSRKLDSVMNSFLESDIIRLIK